MKPPPPRASRNRYTPGLAGSAFSLSSRFETRPAMKSRVVRMIRVLLLTIVVALALAAGAWALFLHRVDHGHPITVGALEDAVKWSEPKLADERVASPSRAGFNALNVTTAWTSGQTAPDPSELAILRNVASASRTNGLQLLITVYAASLCR